MSAETRTQRFSERTIRQVRLDSSRAMVRAKYCPDSSEIAQLRCVDAREETEQSFGSQLWYFEGLGVNASSRRHRVFGVVEYSLQFGLHELVEDRVFDSYAQREEYRHVYQRSAPGGYLQNSANRWLLFGLAAVAMIWLAYLAFRSLIV